jgi:hypothetical protein
MAALLGGVLTLSVLLYAAPGFTLTVGGIFGALCAGLWLAARLAAFIAWGH